MEKRGALGCTPVRDEVRVDALASTDTRGCSSVAAAKGLLF